ncbi:MAG TPA: 4Fe-4S dicluster domain-containing protein [Acidimicrobiia bacterium]|nr:4Fe-4S dicluster domain-containing protein [Acidimicrobiia bacterium]
MSQRVVHRENMGHLFDALAQEGYTIVGPRVRDDAIVYDELDGVDDLPIGWTDDQEAGRYRLRRRDDEALFGYAVGQHSWKKVLYPPRTTLIQVTKANGSLQFTQTEVPETRYAFLGVRACELAAIAIQDRVFLNSGEVDRTYQTARQDVFTVAVNCMVAGGTCFCVSMETGPRCTSGYDLVLTEIIEDGRHEFVFEAGSESGERVLSMLPGRSPTNEDATTVDRIVERTTASMGRSMDTAGIKELLLTNLEHPRWEEVANRCLACTNCTLVCPTCFCSTTEDTVTLDGVSASRSRRWDSCFTMDFSSLHGVPVRESTRSRYRQWMTHKLATWFDQFGSSGCVGCGRCITWCPVGIDITEEVAAIRASQDAGR